MSFTRVSASNFITSTLFLSETHKLHYLVHTRGQLPLCAPAGVRAGKVHGTDNILVTQNRCNIKEGTGRGCQTRHLVKGQNTV